MNIDEIKNILYKYYQVDDEDAEKGCYINGKWLSIKNIIDILKEMR